MTLTRTTRVVVAVILLGFAFGLGYWKASKTTTEMDMAESVQGGTEEKAVKFWTCSMHPQIHQPGPGQCPICAMDLIPVTDEAKEDLRADEIELSEYARKLAQVETVEVVRRFVPTDVRMFGKIEYDESRIRKISAWMSGRLDRLFVDYTGIPVEKGQHLVEIYSPELVTAQHELLQAKRSLDQLKNSSFSSIQGTAESTVEAVREKLRLLGLSDAQIEAIEQQEKATDRITVYAPISGIVIHKNAVEGAYVKVGSEIYTIADLSRVWLLLDAYESDLVWIRYGQPVEFEVEAYPGKSFTGTISFIDPVVSEKTRTVKIRVNVDNEESKLKPGMFASAVVHSTMAVQGKVMVPELAGKWMCPMHPEVVKPNDGTCYICGMSLKRTEKLGYASADEDSVPPPLVIPESAPLLTGERAIVYVENPDREGVYEGREIVLGPQAQGHYVVESGLEEGERVVVKGNFKIDSEAQIRAKKSMMSPGEDMAQADHAEHDMSVEMPGMKMSEPMGNSELPARLDPVYEAYFKIWKALSQDDLKLASQGALEMLKRVDEVNMSGLVTSVHTKWMKERKVVIDAGETIRDSDDSDKSRAAFKTLADSLTRLAKEVGTSGNITLIQMFCPMAFDNKGASWLQNERGTQNPYFGSMMLKCGEEREVFAEKE